MSTEYIINLILNRCIRKDTIYRSIYTLAMLSTVYGRVSTSIYLWNTPYWGTADIVITFYRSHMYPSASLLYYYVSSFRIV